MMFLAEDGYGWTAWHMATMKCQIEVLHKLEEWAKEVLTPEELKKICSYTKILKKGWPSKGQQSRAN